MPGNKPATKEVGLGPTAPGSGAGSNSSLFDAAYTPQAGYQATYSQIQVATPSLPNYNFGTFYAAWVMDHYGNNWTQGGWIQGNIGGSCGIQSSPVVWDQVNNNGDLTNTYCYPQYSLSPGSAYAFETYATTVSGNTWCNAIYYNGSWNILGGVCYSMPYNYAYQTDAEQAIEYSAPTSGGPYPTVGSDYLTSTEVRPNGGAWKYWDTSVSTGLNDSARQIGQYMGFNSYYTNFYTNRTYPDFSVGASPSTLTLLPGTSGSSSINVTANVTYDAALLGPINLSAYGAPSGSSVSVSPSSLSPAAKQTAYANLNVTMGLLQLTAFTVTVQACGWNGCHYTYVTVQP